MTKTPPRYLSPLQWEGIIALGLRAIARLNTLFLSAHHFFLSTCFAGMHTVHPAPPLPGGCTVDVLFILLIAWQYFHSFLFCRFPDSNKLYDNVVYVLFFAYFSLIRCAYYANGFNSILRTACFLPKWPCFSSFGMVISSKI